MVDEIVLPDVAIPSSKVPNYNWEPSLPFQNISVGTCADYYSVFGCGELGERVELFRRPTDVTSRRFAHHGFDKMLLNLRRDKLQNCSREKYINLGGLSSNADLDCIGNTSAENIR